MSAARITASHLKTAGLIILVAGLAIVATVAYRNSHKTQEPVVFSDRDMLDGLWHYYTITTLDSSNFRTFDRSRQDASTSEGESYTMLRAVWWGDKTTFDRSWSWTQSNLQHTSGDNLFSWYYGQLSNGNYGVDPSIGGNNTATDGDEDIALALIFAYDRWGDQNYLTAAQKIIPDIWTNEVAVIKGQPYLLADNVELTGGKNFYIVNPSYLQPATYKIFAKYDKSHDWNAVADTSYQIIDQSMASPLNKKTSDNLPPDWLALNIKTAATTAIPDNPNLDTNYSYDAMRVPFWLALDYQWNKDPRALQTLQKMTFLTQQWQQNHVLYSSYAHDGTVASKQESPSIYGGALGYFSLVDPNDGKDIYNQKLKALYTPDTNSWKQQLGYYDENWAWFGMAYYDGFIVNLDNTNGQSNSK